MQNDLIAHYRWMTSIAAGLAVATVTLGEPTGALWRRVAAVAFLLLGASAWTGINAAKIAVATGVDPSLIPDVDPDYVARRQVEAMKRQRTWGLVQQLLFVAGGVAAAVSLLANLW